MIISIGPLKKLPFFLRLMHFKFIFDLVWYLLLFKQQQRHQESGPTFNITIKPLIRLDSPTACLIMLKHTHRLVLYELYKNIICASASKNTTTTSVYPTDLKDCVTHSGSLIAFSLPGAHNGAHIHTNLHEQYRCHYCPEVVVYFAYTEKNANK